MAYEKFEILRKCKFLISDIYGSIENIPMKDNFYKDEVRTQLGLMYKSLIKLNYVQKTLDKNLIITLKAEFDSSLSYISIMMERICKRKYITENKRDSIIEKINEILAMFHTWTGNIEKNI